MAEIVQTPIRSEYKDGSIVVSNVKSKIDNSTTSYTVVNTWYDGTPMDDSKVDQFGIYSKYKLTGEYLRENKPQWGELFLEVDTIDEFRSITQYNQFLIRIGYYKAVRLNGYYTKGDTPSSIIYYLSETDNADNGGSIITVGSIKFEHDFEGLYDIRYWGFVGDNITDNSDAFNRLLFANQKGKVKIPMGVYGIKKTVEIPNGSQLIFQGEGRNSGNGAPFGVADGISMITWLGEELIYTKAISSNDPDNCWCEFNNIHINNRTSRKDIDGLVLFKFIRGAMNDVVIARFKNNFVIQNYSYYMSIYNCQFSYGWESNVSMAEQPNHACFSSCRFLLSDGDGVKLNNGQTGITFNSCYFEQNKKSAINVRNTRVVNIINCYFEQNGTQGDKTTSNINITFYDNTLNVDTLVNISGGYAYFRDGIDFVRVVASPNASFGDISVDIKGTAFTAKNFIQDKSTTSPNELSALVRVSTSNAGLLTKVKVNLEGNGYLPAEDGKGVILPIGARPMDYKFFSAKNCGVTMFVRPYWDESGSSAKIREYIRSGAINFLGQNGDQETNKFIDFPELLTSNGYINYGRNTTTTGEQLIRFYDSTSLKAWLNIRSGEYVAQKFRLGTSTGAATINYHTTSPEGVITAATGSLCLVNGVANVNVYHKASGTGNTGWKPLTTQDATTAQKGVVNQLSAIADILIADAVDSTTAIALANANKSKINDLLSKLRTSGILTT